MGVVAGSIPSCTDQIIKVIKIKIELQEPYKSIWKCGYIVTNKENRKNVILYNSNNDRSTVSYARYLMSVYLGRFLDKDEEVDHIDNDKTNDSFNNLQILSKIENIRKSSKGITVTKHGTLSMYRYCKCDLCKKSKIRI